MSYIVKVHRNASLIAGGHSVGHTYLEFIDTNSLEPSIQVSSFPTSSLGMHMKTSM